MRSDDDIGVRHMMRSGLSARAMMWSAVVLTPVHPAVVVSTSALRGPPVRPIGAGGDGARRSGRPGRGGDAESAAAYRTIGMRVLSCMLGWSFRWFIFSHVTGWWRVVREYDHIAGERAAVRPAPAPRPESGV